MYAKLPVHSKRYWLAVQKWHAAKWKQNWYSNRAANLISPPPPGLICFWHHLVALNELLNLNSSVFLLTQHYHGISGGSRGEDGGTHPPHRHIMEFFAELRATVHQLVCSTQQTCCESMHYAACNVEHARIDKSLHKSRQAPVMRQCCCSSCCGD